ncbi:MAG: HEAT repeat domain-containing protein [Dehalococcoidales bacterium]
MKKVILLTGLVFFCPALVRVSSAAVQTLTAPAKFGDDDPRKNALIKLVLDKDQYFLGENILLHYGVINNGPEPLTIDAGGDYRGSPRALRFRITATDEKGVEVYDPYPSRFCAGGLGGESTVEPGEEWWTSIRLMKYCDFDRPGLYELGVYHDLGWESKDWMSMDFADVPLDQRVAPIARITIKLLMPDKKQARDVFETMLSLPRDPMAHFGERTRDHADFTAVRSPVYLPLVEEMVDNGDSRGLEAIGMTPHPDATRALIRFAKSKDNDIAAEARKLLTQRLPAYLLDSPSWSTYKRLSRKSWRDEFYGDVFSLAWNLLRSKDRKKIMDGAEIIRRIGTKEHFPRFLRCMDRVMILMKDDPLEQSRYPRPASATWRVHRTGWRLIEAGADVPTNLNSPGRALLYGSALGRRDDFRPDGWKTALQKLLRHPIPYIRAESLNDMPRPVDESFYSTILDLISDDHPPVQAAACDVAGGTESPRFRIALSALLQRSKDQWIIRAAFDAAVKCGVDRADLLKICAERLGEEDVTIHLFCLMITVIDHNGYGQDRVNSSYVDSVRNNWLRFIEANRSRISDGPLFRIAEPPLTKDPFLRGFTLHSRYASPWPKWQ